MTVEKRDKVDTCIQQSGCMNRTTGCRPGQCDLRDCYKYNGDGTYVYTSRATRPAIASQPALGVTCDCGKEWVDCRSSDGDK